MNSRAEIEELKTIANNQVATILAKLGLPLAARDARDRRGTVVRHDPRSRDQDPSLVIWLNMPGGLSWKRYGSDARGDIIDLVAYLKGWDHHPRRGAGEAIKWLRDATGFRHMTAREREALEAQRRREHQERISASIADADRAQRWARAVWTNAAVELAGTPADRYLRECRGLELEALPRAPRFLRFIAEHKHVDEEGVERMLPCLVACCVDPTGDVRAVHRTWLRPDGSDKADVKPARKCFPNFAGLVIPVWKGDTRMSVREAIANGVRETIGITEGWEDALAWAIACPQLRIWAAISLDNIGNVTLPECCDGVIVHRQNDWVKRAAVEAFQRAKRALQLQGRPVAEIAALHGKDLNDTLRGCEPPT
jgi:hypothetical protein